MMTKMTLLTLVVCAGAVPVGPKSEVVQNSELAGDAQPGLGLQFASELGNDGYTFTGTFKSTGTPITNADGPLDAESGCGTSNHKCTCKIVNGEMVMDGTGSSHTGTGLIFSCSFYVGEKKCYAKVDMPIAGSNRLVCGCGGSPEEPVDDHTVAWNGCYIPPSHHAFNEIITVVPSPSSCHAIDGHSPDQWCKTTCKGEAMKGAACKATCSEGCSDI
mmetsp:Transcript_17261/g.50067  ORF Transcript_17261/g.50067 Transcript_17261/m.50067 type:complete len:217 (+) Transcript_17261:218-868(+)